MYSHGPELCAEEQNIERSVMATSRLRLFPGWTLTHTDDLPAAFQRGKKMPDRYKPFLAAVSSGKGPARHRPALPEPYWTNRDAPDVLRRAIVQKAPAVGAWGLPEGAEALLGKAATAEAPDVVDDHGRDRQASEQRGGEDEALAAMRAFIWEEERLCRYVGSSDSMTPGVDNALNATTRLSAYLAHGCLSARRLYDEVRQYERRRVRNRSTYWVYHELIMRDFLAFSCRSWGARLFSRDGPLDASGHRWRDPGSSETRRLFLRWTRGATGYPFVDAGMRQLAHDGWMPHLLRQLCAAFLVRDLRIPWRWGAEWFEQRLIDYTPDANYGNWGYRILPVQQLLANGLATEHLTSLEILSWPVVHDPHLEYILRWVPELSCVAETHGALCAREPWRVAEGYAREARIDVRPKRDSPLWVMSVNRVHWPEYQQTLTGVGHTLCFTPASAEVLNASTCPYPPPLVPPIELELLYDQVPVDHSWGTSCRRDDHAAGRQPSGGASSCALPLVLPTPSIRELHMVAVDTSTQRKLHVGAVGKSTRGGCHMIWFRKALRVHDNPALLAARDATAAAHAPLLAVFVLDPWFVTSGRVGRKRLQFLQECLVDLDTSLRRTVGVPLFVPRGTPEIALSRLWRTHGVVHCTWEIDTEEYAKERDTRVRRLAAEQGVGVHEMSGHSLHSLDELLALCPGARPPTKYNDFLRLLKAAGPPATPLPTPSALPTAHVAVDTADAASMAVPATAELRQASCCQAARRRRSSVSRLS